MVEPFRLGWACPFRLGWEGRGHLKGGVSSEKEPALGKARARSLRGSEGLLEEPEVGGRLETQAEPASHKACGEDFGFCPPGMGTRVTV